MFGPGGFLAPSWVAEIKRLILIWYDMINMCLSSPFGGPTKRFKLFVPKKGTKNQKYHCMRTPHPWIDTYIYIYIFRFTFKLHIYTCLHTHSDIHASTRMHTICICTHTYLYVYIYIYIYHQGQRHAPARLDLHWRRGCLQMQAIWTARLWWQGFEGLYIYIYIYMYIYFFSCLKMAFLGFSNNSLEGIYQAHVQTCPFIYIYIYNKFRKSN